MNKVNVRDIIEYPWVSPKGKFASCDKELSVALGRKPDSTDLVERHPFDVEICRIPAGKMVGPSTRIAPSGSFTMSSPERGRCATVAD